jgi:hypothetical protein
VAQCYVAFFVDTSARFPDCIAETCDSRERLDNDRSGNFVRDPIRIIVERKSLWAGTPNPSIIFHSDDWYIIPFSLLWGGVAISWEAAVSGYSGNVYGGTPSMFIELWGIPFILIGQYMIWGRFFYDAWLKPRSFYAITNRRIGVVQNGWKYKTSWIHISAILRLLAKAREPERYDLAQGFR